MSDRPPSGESIGKADVAMARSFEGLCPDCAKPLNEDGRCDPCTPTVTPGPRVVHCKREAFDVYIGRPSKWGNPWKVPRGYDVHLDPHGILKRYESYARSRPELMAALPELRGKVLGCWCAPKPCHGDVLLRLANSMEAS